MTVLTRDREDLLERLIALAGDAEIVQQALRELNSEFGHAPTIDEVVRRILEKTHVEQLASKGS